MILADNTKKCSAVVKFAYSDSLERCGVSEKIAKIFDGSYLSHFYTFEGKNLVVWVGLGKESEFTLLYAKSAAALAAKTMRSLKQTKYAVEAEPIISMFGIDCIYNLVSGMMLGLYRFDGYFTGKQEAYSYTAYLRGFAEPFLEDVQNIIDKSSNLASHVMLARDWVNMPGNLLNPVTLAEKIVEAGQAAGCQTKVVEEDEAKSLGMHLYLSVGQSAGIPCKLVVLRYMGDPDDNEVTALVGKGVTLDTGGYSLKTNAGLLNTKCDMGGAAAVVAATCALAQNKAKTNVIAVVPAVENRLSRASTVPGDVIPSMNGKTVEIFSSDAEGRLILADAMTYAIRVEGATRVVDIATLTGAIARAYGNIRAGLMTNNDQFEDQLLRAGCRASEKYVDLPTDEEYRRLVKGRVADLANSTRVGCGSIVAGLFLREFAEDKPWLHLDIAGVADVDNPVYEYQSTGATGFGAASLYFLLDRHFTAADR